MKLPLDIQIRIDRTFVDVSKRTEVEGLILSLWATPITVGPEQLARAILVLSKGSISKIREIFDSNFYGDPRDVLVIAHGEGDDPGRYFAEPFGDE